MHKKIADNYDQVFLGASLPTLVKCLYQKKKTLIIEKSKYLGGAWSSENKFFKDLDLACHLIVTPSNKDSISIIKKLKKFNIILRKIKKNEFYSDTKKWKSYGKQGPALISNLGWPNMLKKIINILNSKKNINILTKEEVKKIVINNKNYSQIILENRNIYSKKVYFPSYFGLSKIFYFNKNIFTPYKKTKNIHYIIKVRTTTFLKNKYFQGFYYKNSIFDRFSVSKVIKHKKFLEIFFSARVAKELKNKTKIINKLEINYFLKSNKILKDLNYIEFTKVNYLCCYRDINDRMYTINSLKQTNDLIKWFDTLYFGHFLAKNLK